MVSSVGKISPTLTRQIKRPSLRYQSIQIALFIIALLSLSCVFAGVCGAFEDQTIMVGSLCMFSGAILMDTLFELMKFKRQATVSKKHIVEREPQQTPSSEKSAIEPPAPGCQPVYREETLLEQSAAQLTPALAPSAPSRAPSYAGLTHCSRRRLSNADKARFSMISSQVLAFENNRVLKLDTQNSCWNELFPIDSPIDIPTFELQGAVGVWIQQQTNEIVMRQGMHSPPCTFSFDDNQKPRCLKLVMEDTRLISASCEHMIVWDYSNKNKIVEIPLSRSMTPRQLFSYISPTTSGRLIGLQSQDHSQAAINLWNLKTGVQVAEHLYSVQERSGSFFFDEIRKRMFFSSSQGINLWDLSSNDFNNKKIKVILNERHKSFFFNENRLVVLGMQPKARLYQATRTQDWEERAHLDFSAYFSQAKWETSNIQGLLVGSRIFLTDGASELSIYFFRESRTHCNRDENKNAGED